MAPIPCLLVVDQGRASQLSDHDGMNTAAGGATPGRNNAFIRPVCLDVSDSGFEGRGLPPHIEEAARSIARLHAAHHRGATSFQRTVTKLAALLARPWLIGVLT